MKKSNIIAIMILVTVIGLGKVFAADTPATPPALTIPAPSSVSCKDADEFWAQQKAAWQAHIQQQETENKVFRATLQGKTREEIKPLIQQHRAQQEAENKAFEDQMHAKAIAHIQASNKTDAQKAEAIKELQTRWAENDAKHAERKAERQAEHAGRHSKGNGGQTSATPSVPPSP